MRARFLVPAAFAACLTFPATPLAAQLLPNLIVTRVPVIPATLKGGQSFGTSITVGNSSLLFSAGASRTGFYLSAGPVPLPGDILLGAWPTPSIAKNSTATMTGGVRIPVGLKPGRYWFYAMADDLKAVLELNELDNFGHTNALGYPIAGVVDLRISAIGGPASITPGVPTLVPITIQNAGGLDAPGTATGVMLSRDSSIVRSDTMAGWIATPVIGAGQSVTIPWQLDAPLCDDFYRNGTATWIGAIADLFSDVAEHDEFDNTLARAAALTPKPPLGEYLEWRATAEPTTPSTAALLTLLSSEGTRSDLGVTAAQFPGYRYLLVWSGASTFSVDAFTMLSLELLNGPVFVSWFGTIDARGHAVARFVAPKLTTTINGLSIYTHHAYFTPAMQFAGIGAQPVRMIVRP